jgi:hypothetical protein
MEFSGFYAWNPWKNARPNSGAPSNPVKSALNIREIAPVEAPKPTGFNITLSPTRDLTYRQNQPKIPRTKNEVRASAMTRQDAPGGPRGIKCVPKRDDLRRLTTKKFLDLIPSPRPIFLAKAFHYIAIRNYGKLIRG